MTDEPKTTSRRTSSSGPLSSSSSSSHAKHATKSNRPVVPPPPPPELSSSSSVPYYLEKFLSNCERSVQQTSVTEFLNSVGLGSDVVNSNGTSEAQPEAGARKRKRNDRTIAQSPASQLNGPKQICTDFLTKRQQFHKALFRAEALKPEVAQPIAKLRFNSLKSEFMQSEPHQTGSTESPKACNKANASERKRYAQQLKDLIAAENLRTSQLETRRAELQSQMNIVQDQISTSLSEQSKFSEDVCTRNRSESLRQRMEALLHGIAKD